MAPTDDSKKKPSLLYLGGAGILASVVLASAFLIFTFEEADQLVLIKAPLTPVRVAPEDPGGLKINSQNSPVMSLLDEANSGNSPDQEGAEVLVPPESEPELPPITLTEDQETSEQVKQDDSVAPAVEEGGQDKAQDKVEETSAAKQPSPEPVEAVATEAATTPEPESPAKNSKNAQTLASTETQPAAVEKEVKPEPSTASSAAQDTQAEKQAYEQATEQVAPENEITAAINNLPGVQPTERPKTPKIIAPADSDTPTFVVQFAAFKSEGRAKNTAAVLSAKHAERLGDLNIGYMMRDDFWRVVTEPLPRPEAIALCRNFRSVGQDCITKLLDKQP